MSTIKTYQDATDHWAVIAWDWQAPVADSRALQDAPGDTRHHEESSTRD